MDATLDLKTNPNLLVAKKSTKEKLKEAYAKYFAVAKEDDKIRKLYSFGISAYTTIEGLAATIIAPEFGPLIGVIEKLKKTVVIKTYDGVKYVADKIAGVEPDKSSSDEKLRLSEDELETLKDGTLEIMDMILNKNNKSVIDKADDVANSLASTTKGRSK